VGENMKKTISIVLILILVISGFGAVALPERNNTIMRNNTESFEINSISLLDRGEYLSIEMSEATSSLLDVGKPVIPRITKVYTLPFGSTVKNVNVDFSGENKFKINKEINPTGPILIDGISQEISLDKSEEVYSSNEFYPENSYSYHTCTGLEGTEHVVYLSVQCYPVRYKPAKNEITSYDIIDISIDYESPKNQITFPDVYDLLIIAPSKFEQALQPLVDHKNLMGMNTTFKTTNDIYSEYTTGRDNAENIKLFIKDAIEDFGISYVLLVGGRKGNTMKWYVPIRNTNNHVGGDFENGVDSDLYYSDIYKDGGSAFEDWDSNGNDMFAEFRFGSKDIMDGGPDVYVGRLACTSLKQVNTMVDKIISYEETKADDSWFKDMILIGGDTYPESVPGAYEAEIDNDVSAGYMPGFNFIRLWASTGALTGQEDVEEEFSNGAGFIHMAGHANPSVLVTFPPEDVHKEEKIIILQVYDFYNPLHFQPRLKNKEKQPVIVIGGCHNSQFNVTMMNILKGLMDYGLRYFHVPTPDDTFLGPFWKMEWIPNCFSWWLTVKPSGGAIATMGNSGLGMGISGFNYPDGLDGWLLPRFFKNLDVENGTIGEKHVGAAHSAAITDYIIEFNINTDDADRQMVEQWVLLGDPSLVVGGY
jgi:hypothetical protein